MLVIQVNGVDGKASQAGIARLENVFRSAVHAEKRSIGSTLIAELRSEDNLAVASGDRSADELLIPSDTIHVGGVEKGRAEVEGTVDRGNGLRVVVLSIKVGHSHAA